jgi:hypothetical protein
MSARFLFITTPFNHSFAEVLAEVLAPYGSLELSDWQEKPVLSFFNLVFLDAGIFADSPIPSNLTDSLAKLLRDFPSARIVVTSASTTWKRTRDALKVGAVDIIRQSLNPDRLGNDLRPTLQKYLVQNAPD